MASIEDVIARSRQPGEFSERKRFTVERGSAIRKMRKFALANPYYYILELVQAAIANGGQYIDIHVGKEDVTLSYVGGGFTQEQLAQIFDFLFAAKSDLDIADIRQLALGINALMLAEPEIIILESGQGTLESTTRVEIDGRTNTVDVGTPSEALDGTYVRCVGMNRKKLGQGSEIEALETRCLTSPVPIFFNDDPIFGLRTMRTPNLMGYRRVLSFDEGDLYGTIGLATTENTNSIKLLTFGVWVESFKYDFADGARIGGVICFDRLRKTADHNGIVKDAVFDELWARVLPYARELSSGKTGQAHYNIKLLDGTPVNAVEIRELAKDNPQVLGFYSDSIVGDKLALAAQFGHVMGAPVFVVDGEEMRTLELLVGEFAKVIRPRLTPEELAFYKQPLAEPPPLPWLTGPVAMDEMMIAEIRDNGGADGERKLAGMVGRLSRDVTIRATVYTPAVDRHPGKLGIEVRALGRLVKEFALESAFPGHLVVVDVDASPTLLLQNDRPRGDIGGTIAEALAYQVHDIAADPLFWASAAVVEATNYREFDSGSAASRILLAAVARGTIKSVALDPARVAIRCVGDMPPGVLSHPVFPTLDGGWHSVYDIENTLNTCWGLVYGVLKGVEPDLEGLDTSRVLWLDDQQEAALLGIVGEASYVRIDERDILASADGFVVRDIALGLRAYSDAPLLVEHAAGLTMDVVDALVQDLKRVFANTADEAVDEEARRQAARHLIWFLLHADREQWSGIEHLPLFVLEDEQVVSMYQLVRQFGTDPLRMIDGWAVDVASLGTVVHGGGGAVSAVSCLAMNPFVFMALADTGRVSSAYEDVDRELADVPYIVSTWVDIDGVDGKVGLPKDEPSYPVVVVIEETTRKVWTLRAPGRETGLTGILRSKAPLDAEQLRTVQAELVRQGAALLIAALESTTEDDEGEANSPLPRIFAFAGHHLSMKRDALGQVQAVINSMEARKILSLPVFPSRHGGWINARRLIHNFTRALDVRSDDSGWRRLLGEDADPWMVAWCERFLLADAVIRPAARPAVVSPPQSPPSVPEVNTSQALGAWLTDQLEALRPDLGGPRIEVMVVPPDPATWVWRGHHLQIDRDALCDLRMADGEGGLCVVDSHWLCDDALRDPEGMPRWWLLTACYAYINDLLAEVTNAHELQFQAEIIARSDLL